MATIKKCLFVIVCTGLMTSFFSMHAKVGPEVEKNNGPGLGYYMHKGLLYTVYYATKVGLHTAGVAASFYGGKNNEKYGDETTNIDIGLIFHGAGFVLPFFIRDMRLLEDDKKDKKFWFGMGMNAASLITHIAGWSMIYEAGELGVELEGKLFDEEKKDSIMKICTGVLLHSLAGFISEYGCGMIEEQRRGLKVTVKESRRFREKTEQG